MSSCLCLAQASISSGAVVGIAFWTFLTLIVVVPTVGHYWMKMRKDELDVALKQQMIDRGFSPEEILAVLSENPKLLKDRPNKNAKSPAGKMTPSKLPTDAAGV